MSKPDEKPVPVIGYRTRDKARWFKCQYCGLPAATFPSNDRPLFGVDEGSHYVMHQADVIHVAPSCEPYRALSAEEFVERHKDVPPLEMPDDILLLGTDTPPAEN